MWGSVITATTTISTRGFAGSSPRGAPFLLLPPPARNGPFPGRIVALPMCKRLPDFEPPPISAVIPALNEARALPATLAALDAVPEVEEVIVVDGGSTDGTVALAARSGAHVVVARRGRGTQLREGAERARGGILWFVHADTLVPPDAGERILASLEGDPSAVGGVFAVRFDGPSLSSRWFTRAARILQWTGGLYGDAALFVRRKEYDAAGGFGRMALFEDVDLVRRLRRRGRLLCLSREVVTSSRRFAGEGTVRTLARWAGLHLLFRLGASPAGLSRYYAPVRDGGPGRVLLPERKLQADSRRPG